MRAARATPALCDSNLRATPYVPRPVVPDTTLRALLVQMDPESLRIPIHNIIRAAHRRKALEPSVLPFGMLVMDGKVNCLSACDDHYAQRQKREDGLVRGLLRTVTCVLASAPGAPCIDAVPIHASTNEAGTMVSALKSVLKAYDKLDLFQVVSYDAGGCSLANANELHDELHKDYLFGLKGSQPTLFDEAKAILSGVASDKALAATVDKVGGGTVTRSLFLSEDIAGFHEWTHLRTVVRVRSEKRDHEGKTLSTEDRYFITSLAMTRLSHAQWLWMIRRHWAVENDCHWTLDAIFEEDDRPWIKSDVKGALAALLLRRLAYTLVTLFRAVTQRSEERRAMPWKKLLEEIADALKCASNAMLAPMRERAAAALA